jgi:hypothetical protein
MRSHALTSVATAPRYAALDRLGDEIALLSAHLDAAAARLLALIREFDARGGWNSGFRSCAAWLSWRVGLDLGAARERVRVARALGTLPLLAQALARGELSYAKVRALTRVATPEIEARLLAFARAGTAAHVERLVRGWRRVDRRAEAREAALRHARRGLRVYQDEDGMVVIRGRLEPEVGALLVQALAAARETLYQRSRRAAGEASGCGNVSAETPSLAQRQADALALLAESALHRGLDPGAPGDRYQVVVHIDAPVLADPEQPGQSILEDGTRVSAETSQRLACDASRVMMRHDAKDRVVEVGARTRTIPPALRRVLQHRDRGCRFPGCGVRVGEGHHIQHWAHGGPLRSRTWRSSAAVITAPCMKRAIRSSEPQMASFGSGFPTDGRCPRCRCLRQCPTIPCRISARGRRRRACVSTRALRCQAGSGSRSMSAGRSTFCTRWRRDLPQPSRDRSDLER